MARRSDTSISGSSNVATLPHSTESPSAVIEMARSLPGRKRVVVSAPTRCLSTPAAGGGA
eukprot:scaffold15799_cov28-Tisochrysis_lutea.AAC.5